MTARWTGPRPGRTAQQYAEAFARYDWNVAPVFKRVTPTADHYSVADALMAVRDTELEELRRRAELADAVTAETKRLMARRTTILRTRAEMAEAALVRVWELHRPVEGLGWKPDGSYGTVPQACSACVSDEYAVPWPCPTIRALDSTEPTQEGTR